MVINEETLFAGVHIICSDLVDSHGYVSWEKPIWFIGSDAVWLEKTEELDQCPNGYLIGNKLFCNKTFYEMIMEEIDGVHRKMGSVHTYPENWRELGKQSSFGHLQSRP
jgi:hypothetical protein